MDNVTRDHHRCNKFIRRPTCSNNPYDDVADIEGPLVEEEPPLAVRQNVFRQNAVRAKVGDHPLGRSRGIEGAADNVGLKEAVTRN